MAMAINPRAADVCCKIDHNIDLSVDRIVLESVVTQPRLESGKSKPSHQLQFGLGNRLAVHHFTCL